MGINQSKDVLNHSKMFIACEWSIAIVVLQALTFTNFQTCINKIYYNEKNNKQGMTLIGAKICALMAHIRYALCTKGHSNHPTWPKSMLRP